MRAKYKHYAASQSKVILTCCHHTLTLNVTISIDAIATTQGRALEVPGVLHNIISKCPLCTRVSHALLQTRILTQTDHLRHSDTKTMRCTKIRHFLYCYMTRSSSLLSLSPPSRRFLVPIFFSRQNPKQSSKVLLPPVHHCPKI